MTAELMCACISFVPLDMGKHFGLFIVISSFYTITTNDQSTKLYFILMTLHISLDPSSGVYKLENYTQVQLITFQSRYFWNPTLQNK